MMLDNPGSESDKPAALAASHPVLSCEDSAQLEHVLLDSDSKVWEAMQSVGRQLGRGILDEYRMTRFSPPPLSVFALVGKGHNGGDALLVLAEMARQGVLGKIVVAIAGSLADLKPNTKRAFDILESQAPDSVLSVFCCRSNGEASWLEEIDQTLSGQVFDIALDGLLGMSFKAPLRPLARGAIQLVNDAANIRLRVAVDLPSGVGEVSDSTVFRADVTFATGILKKPLLNRALEESIGNIRYLDLGFFDDASSSGERVVVDSILEPLRSRRPAFCEKRSFGHLLIVAGSRSMPGALIMSVCSALKSGVGLVTVCAPESLVTYLATEIPEAMWIAWPETPEGGLALEGLHLLRELRFKPTATLVGPGLGSEGETIAMLAEALKGWTSPLVIDADALHPEILDVVSAPFIATPHLGEFRRLLGSGIEGGDIDRQLQEYAREHGGVVALKGPNTRVAAGECLYVNTTGNSILARGGSGDLLAGMMAGLLASLPEEPVAVACRAVYWHGKAADTLATRSGQVAVRTTDLLDTYVKALMMSPHGEGINT
jgi:hydroxyethylthiazole kinase-like uncharacterized protein yjeF